MKRAFNLMEQTLKYLLAKKWGGVNQTSADPLPPFYLCIAQSPGSIYGGYQLHLYRAFHITQSGLQPLYIKSAIALKFSDTFSAQK